ncbi:amidohydrolase family protein (plasmid) [Variovorax sp. V213]|uniref:amidohydrolase family protein n=1 Tax=Variovorax sp. V213 TaxID=3065955 RepID=UPI0034E89E34
MLSNVSAPQQRIPSRTCDCHVHVFDPGRFPLAASRTYTPGIATVTDLQAMQARLGVERVVLVQPSCYGTDNGAVLDAIARIGQAHARGIAVLDFDKMQPSELHTLHAQGIRGIRLNFATQRTQAVDDLRAHILKTCDVVATLGWSLQLHCHATLIEAIAPTLARLSTPLVLDHFAGFRAASWSSTSPAWAALRGLLDAGNTYVKLSAPYRVSERPAQADLDALARALVRAAPHRMLWGSDWPHTGGAGVRTTSPEQVEPFREVDAGRSLDQLCTWTDIAIRQLILVDNPARLFGFDDAPASRAPVSPSAESQP